MRTLHGFDESRTSNGEVLEVPLGHPIPAGFAPVAPPEAPEGFAVWVNGTWRVMLSKPKAPPEPVPEWVYMRQARRALQDAGLLSAIQPAITALPEPSRTTAQIEWDYSQKVFRNRGIVVDMAASLGISG